MARMTAKKKKVVQLMDAGKTLEEIVKETGYKEAYVKDIFKPQEEDKSPSDMTLEDLKIEPEVLKVENKPAPVVSTEKVEVPKDQQVLVETVKPTIFDSGVQQAQEVIKETSKAELEKTKNLLAKSAATIETAIFRGLSDGLINFTKEEQETLQTGFKCLTNIYVKEEPKGDTVALILFASSQASVLLGYTKEIKMMMDKRKVKAEEQKHIEPKTIKNEEEEKKPEPVAMQKISKPLPLAR